MNIKKPIYSHFKLVNPPSWFNELGVCTTFGEDGGIFNNGANRAQLDYRWLQGKFAEIAGQDTLFVIDIEFTKTSLVGKDAITESNIFMDFIKAARKLSAKRVGIYDFPQKGASDIEANRSFVAQDEAIIDVLRKVDFLAPSLYRNQSLYEWQKMAIRIRKRCEEICPGKDVLPYMWCLFHESTGGGLAKTHIPTTEWKYMVDVIYDLFDGMILWSIDKNTPPDHPNIAVIGDLLTGARI